jgi:hypothetical protein
VPAVEQRCRGLGHNGGKGCYLLPVKRGLDETALPSPEVAIAGGQPRAQKGFERLPKRAFSIVPVIRLEHIANMIRMAEGISPVASKAQGDHTPILPRCGAMYLSSTGRGVGNPTLDLLYRLAKGMQADPRELF